MMLKHLLFLFVFVSFESNTQAQNPEQILKTSQTKCLAIKNGYYDLHMRMKFMDSKDTSWDLEEKFYFNKLKKDSIYSIAFNSELFSHGNYIRNRLYNGDYFVTYSKTDSKGKIMAKNKWADKIKEDSHNQIASLSDLQ